MTLSINTPILTDQNLIKKVVKENKDRCSSCGIKLTSDYVVLSHNNENITACSVCKHIYNLQTLPDRNGGQIILLPEIAQSDLINLQRGILYLKSLKGKIEEEHDSLELIEDELNERAALAEHHFSKSISNPLILVQLLYTLSEKEYGRRNLALTGMKWLPSLNFFKKEQVELKSEMEKFNPKNWKKLIAKLKDKKV